MLRSWDRPCPLCFNSTKCTLTMCTLVKEQGTVQNVKGNQERKGRKGKAVCGVESPSLFLSMIAFQFQNKTRMNRHTRTLALKQQKAQLVGQRQRGAQSTGTAAEKAAPRKQQRKAKDNPAPKNNNKRQKEEFTLHNQSSTSETTDRQITCSHATGVKRKRQPSAAWAACNQKAQLQTHHQFGVR